MKSFLEFSLINIGDTHLKVYTIFIIISIFFITKLLLTIIKNALGQKRLFSRLDEGTAYAIFKIIKYIVWLIAIGFFLESIGVKITLLIAGSAALLVGVGLGLQQTFNDIISGIILLSERSIKLGDILEIDGDVIKVQVIGLRTSKGLNRDEITVIIPNSLITTNKVINWSHQSKKTRFRINIGVSYESDIEQVIQVLESSIHEHSAINNKNLIEARLVDFGSSSINFQVLFFTENIFEIERIKSDIRRIIHAKLKKNNITIPFPQMDIHIDKQDKEFKHTKIINA
ncbi:mechanosensitive ion channel family protein [Saccharicrinis fermentans]|uniref:Potassium efflux system KefA n=1 Tax=Saccharicrinis fermentans DSM 9555 = JCM 21142 TaxID=869213 RepID=W7YDW6_9BACT|nr:mechanosensitive ion channel domain-containing protein [Saccharicrinis fermentans]GAF05658.1 potassium efflux system KefA precursor [Saccharicrinis fermentans DSM 9555 = JCM 21142]